MLVAGVVLITLGTLGLVSAFLTGWATSQLQEWCEVFNHHCPNFFEALISSPGFWIGGLLFTLGCWFTSEHLKDEKKQKYSSNNRNSKQYWLEDKW